MELVGWTFLTIIILCIYVLIGLYITEHITQISTLIFTWIIYTCLCFTLINIFVLSYFWESIRNKTGPVGIRGISGDTGEQGLNGSCDVTEVQGFFIKALNEYIDKLYFDKTGTHILNTETQKFPSNYLSNKIATQAGSRQYRVLIGNLSNQNKTVDDIINYVKSIWKVWFDLIYNANPEWFLDEYGDENYQWRTSSIEGNPFTEIRKYDIYYWGITRSFRPLKAEICRTTPEYKSSKVPLVDTEPRLKIIETNDYDGNGNDYKTGGNPDASFWRAKSHTIGSDTYYSVGDIVMAGDKEAVYWNPRKTGQTVIGNDMAFDIDYKKNRLNGPDMKTIIVAGDVVNPIGYENQCGVGGRQGLVFATPICPTGYTHLGDSLIQSSQMLSQFENKCVPADCVEDNYNPEYTTWTQNCALKVQNDWTRDNKSANGENGYNLFRINGTNKFKRIKGKCLQSQRKQLTKEPEPENDKLGIGWYGHPYKLDPKYSIFTFLGLVPEGMIVNTSTGRRFYIIHYGGDEANIYNVLDYNDETQNFDNALEVDETEVSGRVRSSPISRKKETQQWTIIISGGGGTLKLKNKYNNYYLYVGLNPYNGQVNFSAIDLDYDNYKSNEYYSALTNQQIMDSTNFTFISTFGTQLDIIDKAKPKEKKFVIGNRVRLSTQKDTYLNIFGVFIYGENGKIINIDPRKAFSSSIYYNQKAENALKIVNENRDRNINNAIANSPLRSKPDPLWNQVFKNDQYLTHTDNDKTATTGGAWWEYKFENPEKIRAIEIWGRSDCCPERFRNLLVEIFDDTLYSTSENDPVWNGNIGYNIENLGYHKTFVIEKHGIIRHPPVE